MPEEFVPIEEGFQNSEFIPFGQQEFESESIFSLNVVHQQESAISFCVKDEVIMDFRTNGDIYVRGEKIDNNKDAYIGFLEFLHGTGNYHGEIPEREKKNVRLFNKMKFIRGVK
jgi:hypothetical protein